MVNPILDVKQECRKLVENAIASAIKSGALPEAELPAFNIEIPSDVTHGDFRPMLQWFPHVLSIRRPK